MKHAAMCDPYDMFLPLSPALSDATAVWDHAMGAPGPAGCQ